MHLIHKRKHLKSLNSYSDMMIIPFMNVSLPSQKPMRMLVKMKRHKKYSMSVLKI